MKSVNRMVRQSLQVITAVLLCALLLLPSEALAIYPSGGGLPDIGLDRSLQGSDQATEAFKEKFPLFLFKVSSKVMSFRMDSTIMVGPMNEGSDGSADAIN